jgi:putative transposase
MNEINTILQSLKQIVSATELQQMAVIVSGLLAMSGSVTMLNLARWTGEGGSYRTVQRFYNAPLNWLQMNWALSQMSCQTTGGIHLLVGDETVVTKAGKESFGLGRFFSSIYQRCVPGLCFFGVSLVSVASSESTMLLFEQQSKGESTVKSRDASQKPSQPAVTQATKRKGGRPKGSQNQNRRNVELSPALQKIQGYLRQVLQLIGDKVNIPYCVLDGAYGNNPALQMVRQLDLHLISKLNKNAALYFPFEGEQKKRGARRKYGSKLDYRQLPDAYRKQSSLEAGVQTDVYQMQLFSKQFPDLLNVVILVKTKLATHQSAHVVLFSSDLLLAQDQLILYYRLRFQIEFNFRQAKQFWGLEDFMNVKQRPVYNAANLALFMTNFSSALLRLRRATIPDFGLHDLKADFRSRFYLTQTLKRLPFLPDSVSIDDLFAHLSRIGAVHS